jgi:uncharacterized protein (DUF2062 family)
MLSIPSSARVLRTANRAVVRALQVVPRRWRRHPLVRAQLLGLPSPRQTALGTALGLLVCLWLPIGQLPVAALLAFALRGSVPAAAIATFVTNPLTMPMVYALAHRLGDQVLSVVVDAPGVWTAWLFGQTLLSLSVAAVGGSLAGALWGRLVLAPRPHEASHS